MNQFVILSFGVDPLNWPSFIEIGEIACSTPAWCTHGLTLKITPKKELSYPLYFHSCAQLGMGVKKTVTVVINVKTCISLIQVHMTDHCVLLI